MSIGNEFPDGSVAEKGKSSRSYDDRMSFKLLCRSADKRSRALVARSGAGSEK